MHSSVDVLNVIKLYLDMVKMKVLCCVYLSDLKKNTVRSLLPGGNSPVCTLEPGPTMGATGHEGFRKSFRGRSQGAGNTYGRPRRGSLSRDHPPQAHESRCLYTIGCDCPIDIFLAKM